MICKETFNQLMERYSPLVKWIIESDGFYACIDESIKWQFTWDDHVSITGAVDRSTNILKVILAFIDQAYKNGRIYEIEYFILHEMRHIYQHNQIKTLNAGGECTIDPVLVAKWKEEGEQYVTAIDEVGKENVNYFKQDCELDAYSFSFAVMSVKYRGIYDDLLYIPPIYKEGFREGYDSAVKEFKMRFLEIVR